MTGYPRTAAAWAAELARAAGEIEAVAAVLAGHAVDVGENTTSSAWPGAAVEVEVAARELTGAAARLRAAAALLAGARTTGSAAGRDSAPVKEPGLVLGYRYLDREAGPAAGDSEAGRVLEVVAGRSGHARLVFTVEDRGARGGAGSRWQVAVGAADPLVLADPDITALWIELAFGRARDLGQIIAMLVQAGAQESAALGTVEHVPAACRVRPDQAPVTGIDAAPGATAAVTVGAEDTAVADFEQDSVDGDAHRGTERAARGGRPIWDSEADIADYHRVWGD
ncbi:hypothetical protein ACIGO9_29765 [Nocardia asteroides]|uniref:hypothetical protein n=1 Tax=Nocardia asteroides TaxID=1824 RepID=UPI0037CA2C07